MNRKPLAALLLVSSLGLASGFAQAQSSQPARSGAGHSAAGVQFTTGGVGLTARQELASRSSEYNLQLVFAHGPEGEYLAAVAVDIVDARGNNVLSTTTDGPWLLAKLPAGSYTVKAKFGDVTRTQQVSVGEGKRRLVMRFPASADQPQSAGSSGTRDRTSG